MTRGEPSIYRVLLTEHLQFGRSDSIPSPLIVKKGHLTNPYHGCMSRSMFVPSRPRHKTARMPLPCSLFYAAANMGSPCDDGDSLDPWSPDSSKSLPTSIRFYVRKKVLTLSHSIFRFSLLYQVAVALSE